jgi:hypothetical protein
LKVGNWSRICRKIANDLICSRIQVTNPYKIFAMRLNACLRHVLSLLLFESSATIQTLQKLVFLAMETALIHKSTDTVTVIHRKTRGSNHSPGTSIWAVE